MTARNASRKRRRGQALIEMTFVGIPIIFVLISVFEISRGMWMYHTLAYSVREGVRYASVHGINCVHNPPSVNNNCPGMTVADVALVIQKAGVGLDLGTTQLTFTSAAGTISCSLSTCSANPAQWPPPQGNQVGQTIQIFIITPFRSAIAMLWPGSKPTSFAATNLAASSTDQIQF
jgi:Flp pilus assembly protein TadG